MIRKPFFYLNVVGVILNFSFSFGICSENKPEDNPEINLTSISSMRIDDPIVLFEDKEDKKVEPSESRTVEQNDEMIGENYKDISRSLARFKDETFKITGIQRQNFSIEKLKDNGEPSVLENYFMSKCAPITYFTALSLDGGGIRGYLEALFLQELRKQVKRPLHRIFDYIGGTSIGGILSLGLTTPKPSTSSGLALEPGDKLSLIPALEPEDMISLFKDKRENIFPPYKNISGPVPHPITEMADHYIWKIRNLSYPGYEATNLENLLQNILGSKTYLHNTLTNVAITAVRIGKESQPFIFDSYEARRVKSTNSTIEPIRLWEVGRSTSAAPTYFPAHEFKHQQVENGNIKSENIQLIDGGLWLNNPASLVARQLYKWVEAQNMIIWPKNIVMLSLGTGCADSDYPLAGDAGQLRAVRPLIDTLMTTSSMNVDLSMKDLMGKNYFRINPKLPENIPLDSIKPDDLTILEQAFDYNKDKIKEFVEERLRKVLELDPK